MGFLVIMIIGLVAFAAVMVVVTAVFTIVRGIKNGIKKNNIIYLIASVVLLILTVILAYPMVLILMQG
ncbi:MAG: hypothetical protein FWG90_03945 [Oscillospiraceae bacterium]|nr:hypothetical protein [Oscillospiraceae bacterium]